MNLDQITLNFIYFLAAVGALSILITVWKCIWAFILWIIPSKDLPARYGRHTWAVITGGSDGIGLGFCE